MMSNSQAARPLTPRSAPIWVFGMLCALLWAFPFLWMVSTSLKPVSESVTGSLGLIPHEPTLRHYVEVFRQYPMGRWALNSFFVSAVATVFGVFAGAMAGYALARIDFRGRKTLFALFLSSMMVPAEVSVVPMLIAFLTVGWASSFQALILPALSHVISMYIFRQYFLSFPREIEEAAIVDGASRWSLFWRIAFPMARAPAIASGVILFNMNWNSFLWPLLITFEESMKTMPVGVAAFAPTIGSHTQIEGYGMGMAAVTLLSIPSLAIFFVFQRYFISGISAGAVKS